MPLETQLLELNIASGLAQQIDPRLLPNGTWAQLDNMLQSRNGSAEKRLGYQQLPILVYPNSPVEFLPSVVDVLDTRGDEWRAYGEHTDGLFWSWSWSESAERWIRKDTVSQCSVSTRPVIAAYVSVYLPQIARTADGHDAWTWITAPTGGLGAGATCVQRVFDAGGAVSQDDIVIATGAGQIFVTLVACGDLVVTLTWDTGTGAATAAVLNASTGAYIATYAVGAGIMSTFDASPLSATEFVVAYRAAANVITLSRITASTGAVAATVGYASVADPFAVTVAADATGGIAVATSDATGINVWTRHPTTLAAVWGPTSLGILPAAFGFATSIDDTGRTATVWGDQLAPNFFSALVTTDNAGAVAITSTARNTFATSRPFWRAGNAYTAGCSLSASPGGSYLLCWTSNDSGTSTPLMVAKLSSLGTTQAPTFNALPRVVQDGDTVLVPIAGALSTKGGVYFDTGAFVAECDFTRRQSALLWSTEQRDCLAHSGGFAAWWDGTAEVEAGFPEPPTPNAPATLAAFGGGIPAGVYVYAFCWEWVDTAGNVHRSPVATQSVTTVLAASSVTFDLYTSTLTRRGDPGVGGVGGAGVQREPTLAVFRTIASGQILFRITPPKSGSTVVTKNDKSVFTVQVVDTLTDAALTALGYGQIYTSGDIVEDVMPPPARAIVTHRNRLWIASGEDTRELWFSKLIVPGEAPGFSPLLTLRVDDASDGVTALGSLDDKLIVFTRDRIYYVSGDGPNDTAAGGVFNGPFRLPTDFGCSDQRSVVMYPDGIMFWNGSGIYKLDRSLQVSFVGEPVVDETTGADAVIAKLDPANSRVWFLIFTTSGSFSRFAVFDYRVSVWTTETVYGETGGGESPILVTAHHWHGGLHRIGQESSAEGVCEQGYGTAPGYDLEAAYFPATIETPWIHVAGVNGFQRVRRVWITGEQLAAHKLTVQIFTDYNAGAVRQEVTFDADVGSPMLGLPRERLAVHVLPQQCSAIKIRVFDSAPDDPVLGTPTGYNIVAITLELGVKGGYKLPAVNRAGG